MQERGERGIQLPDHNREIGTPIDKLGDSYEDPWKIWLQSVRGKKQDGQSVVVPEELWREVIQENALARLKTENIFYQPFIIDKHAKDHVQFNTPQGRIRLKLQDTPLQQDEVLLYIPQRFDIPDIGYGNYWCEIYPVNSSSRSIRLQHVNAGAIIDDEGKSRFDNRWRSVEETMWADYFSGQIPGLFPYLRLLHITLHSKVYNLLSPRHKQHVSFGEGITSESLVREAELQLHSQIVPLESGGCKTIQWMSKYFIDEDSQRVLFNEQEILFDTPGKPARYNAFPGIGNHLLIGYLKGEFSEDVLQASIYIPRWPKHGTYAFFTTREGPQVNSKELSELPAVFILRKDERRGYICYDLYQADGQTRQPIGARVNSFRINKRVVHPDALISNRDGWLGIERQAIQDWIDGTQPIDDNYPPMPVTRGSTRTFYITRDLVIQLPLEMREGDEGTVWPYIDEDGVMSLNVVFHGKSIADYRYSEVRRTFLRTDSTHRPPDSWTRELIIEDIRQYIGVVPITESSIRALGRGDLASAVNAHVHGFNNLRSELAPAPSGEQLIELSGIWLSSGLSFQGWVNIIRQKIRQSDISDLPSWLQQRILVGTKPILGLNTAEDLYFALPRESDERMQVGWQIAYRLNPFEEDAEMLLLDLGDSIRRKIESDPQLRALYELLGDNFAEAYAYLILQEYQHSGNLEELIQGIYKSLSVKGRSREYMGPMHMDRGKRSVQQVIYDPMEYLSNTFLSDERVLMLLKQKLMELAAVAYSTSFGDGEGLLSYWQEQADTPEKQQLVHEVREQIQWLLSQRDERFVAEIGGYPFPSISQLMVLWAAESTNRAFVWAETGAGKSGAALYAMGGRRTLIFAPSDARYNTWMPAISQVRKDNPEVLVIKRRYQLENILRRFEDPSQREETERWLKAKQYTVLSLDALSFARTYGKDELYIRFLDLLDPEGVIVDEVHDIRRLEANATKMMIQLMERFHARRGRDGRIIYLTATAVVNSLADLDTPMTTLHPDLFPKVGDFSRACLNDPDFARRLLRSSESFCHWTRREIRPMEQSHVTYHTEKITMSPGQQKLYQRIFRESFYPLNKIHLLMKVLLDPQMAAVAIKRLIPELAPNMLEAIDLTEHSAKYTRLLEMIDQALTPDADGRIAKIAVISPRFIEGITQDITSEEAEELSSLRDLLEIRYGYERIVAIDGTVSPHQTSDGQSARSVKRDRYRFDPDTILLGSDASASFGVDLSIPERGANQKIREVQLIFLHPPFTSMRKEQFVGRFPRAGGVQRIKVVTLECWGADQVSGSPFPTFDVALARLVHYKDLLTRSILHAGSLNDDELRTLFRGESEARTMLHWLEREVAKVLQKSE